MLRKILGTIVLLIAIPLIAALFTKQDYEVITSVTIDKPVAEVFDYIKYLKNQDNYSVWAKLDPNMTKSYRGVDASIGFVSAWESLSEEVGVGEQEIISIEEGKRIGYELRFISPFEAVSPAFMSCEPITKETTKVTWGFKGHMDYPMNLILVFMDFETMIERDLTQGLVSLKEIMEK
ncbi:SRPBCC family protein [Shewanella nanhaiensis]|uniref:SRPBCC family protein n=1 Tax=Shewanella nanhaiensis TaxID=2864872 RepID=A0ABS7DZU3_9GAMM|nr:SRPBCC family protein [Shewanella nanhaiensis]MBW8182943.1 SRPBCC family protein [Shewanella nanhaiensis]